MVQSQVTDAKRTLKLLTSTATEKKIDADNKKACYFKALPRALELAIDREATGIDLTYACDDANEDLPTLDYKYCTAGAAANRGKTAEANATNKLQLLTRRLAEIKLKETPEIADAVTRAVIPTS